MAVSALLEVGAIIWMARLDGYFGTFASVDFSKSRLLLQNNSYFWQVSDGSRERYDEFMLDFNGTTCSTAVRVGEDQYAVNSDLGIHVFKLDLS
ncbi:MAG TPA: hypothetical protein DEB25_00100 [Desulfobulbaceae bacterium]|nr:hypothetical protein [Desulfobulbaceae bacterium]